MIFSLLLLTGCSSTPGETQPIDSTAYYKYQFENCQIIWQYYEHIYGQREDSIRALKDSLKKISIQEK